ncbi:hypothetical protein LQZ19_14910 [Treponema primitia]|uniref:hypothetical protein n=1 Tax=Treponema primitia TaxID=88058 RepID=UPI00397FD514
MNLQRPNGNDATRSVNRSTNVVPSSGLCSRYHSGYGAGGFSSEDGVFKALALGSPYVKAVCMGRALMIPGMVGKNIALWIKDGNLPKTVSDYGNSLEEIFVNYEKVKSIVGSEEIDKIPLGAIGIYSYADKLKVGLQQLMAGARRFNLSIIRRKDIMSLTEECTKVTGIPYLMECYRSLPVIFSHDFL